jgi:hypothetical protein
MSAKGGDLNRSTPIKLDAMANVRAVARIPVLVAVASPCSVVATFLVVPVQVAFGGDALEAPRKALFATVDYG